MLPLRLIFLMLFLIVSWYVFGQNYELTDLSLRHFEDQKKGMIILGSWGLGNAVIGGIGLSKSDNPETRAFHQMNLGWGLVNTAIAGFGYYSAMHGQLDPNQPMELLLDNQKLKSILLLNTGLDVAYIASGFYLMERSKRSTDDAARLKGFGKSLIMQGAFLFAFDLGMYIHFNNNTGDIIRLFNQGGQMGMIINF
jgi:hypothetical protein